MKLHDKDLSVKIGRDTTLCVGCVYYRIGDDNVVMAGVQVKVKGETFCKLVMIKNVDDSFYHWCMENIPADMDTQENFVMKFDYGKDFDMKYISS